MTQQERALRHQTLRADELPKPRKPRPSRFAQGYQEALRDISTALTANGLDGVQEWLDNNMKQVPQ